MQSAIKVIAFYLPQYHEVEENNRWFGQGFTEWTNVRKAKPLFEGHYQPVVPGELGYYDLKNPEVRAKQAALAKEAGVSAFCYYHYWFGHGKQLLEKPLEEVVRLREPDMPFCLCWANHRWLKKTWNSETSVLDQVPLLDIDYGDEADWRLHFDTLLPMFQDSRYYKIDGRPVFVLYRIQDIPDVDKFKACWDQWLRESYNHQSTIINHQSSIINHQSSIYNLQSSIINHQSSIPSGFYWLNYIDDEAKLKDPIQNSCEAKILMLKDNMTSIRINNIFLRKLSRYLRGLVSQWTHRSMNIFSYEKNRHQLVSPLFAREDVIPTLIPNWDNTARRQEGATVLHGACPEQFYLHCKETFAFLKNKKNKVVFLKSWNEWGEGNYIEPDDRYGRGWMEALRKALDEFGK